MLLKERLGFGAGNEHEHQQAHVVDQVERGFFGRGCYIQLQQMNVSRPLTQHKRSQEDPRQNLPNYPRLAQFCKKITQQMSAGKKNCEEKNEGADSAGRHTESGCCLPVLG